jgi:hypothetical protein
MRSPPGKGVARGRMPCWLAAADASPIDRALLDDDSRALLGEVERILSPRWPAQPLMATSTEIESLEADALRIGGRLPLVPAPTDQAGHFDRRFGLRRSRDPNVVAPALARATAIAVRLRSDPGASPGDIEAIAEGLAQCVATYRDHTEEGRALPPEGRDAHPAAMSRRRQWDEGHQLFVVLGQETIFTLARLESALLREDWAAAREGYVDAVTLFRAIGATMRRTGAMAPSQYASVRRSMMPPNVPDGFSGLWDAGHKRILSLTRAVARLPHDPNAQAMLNRYHMALHLLFHAHSSVCEHVIGEKASLAAQASRSAPPAHVVLRSFAKRALSGAGYKEAQ